MLKGLSDLAGIMKLQKEFKNIQKNIARTKLEGYNSDESVKAVVTGDYTLQELKISPELAGSGDHKKIEGEVIIAVNSAVQAVKEFSASEMSRLTGGMGPEIMNMLR